jgi:disulfide bond formation protein DsbB
MKFIKENTAQLALFLAIIASIGTLFFSEYMKLTPCVLCWYQRICMYPLVIILSIGIWKKDKNLSLYALPLSIIGIIISTYHNLLYYGIIPESISPCTVGTSCTSKQIELFGFITIPFLSLIAFLIITSLLILHKKFSANDTS